MDRVLEARAREPSEHDLHKGALVFAPHPDDETLACGGTIALKRRAGAEVGVVFMTDGSRSHAHVEGSDQLRAVREKEANAALDVLRVTDRVFLGIGDGELARESERATELVTELVAKRRPQQVFVPHRRDGPLDHVATFAVVRSALDRAGLQAELLEYPVWLWHRWPWVPADGAGLADERNLPREGRKLAVALRLLAELRYVVSIEPVEALKRDALACYRSQLEPLRDDVDWPTLGSVAEGEFLRCFQRNHEAFYRHGV